MEISIEQYNKIQRYLDDEMDDWEESAFEKELNTDKILKDNYIFETEVRQSLANIDLKEKVPYLNSEPLNKQNEDSSLRNIIAKAGNEWIQSKQNKKNLRKAKIVSFEMVVSAAVAACVIGILISVISISPEKPEKQAIAKNIIDSVSKRDSAGGVARNSITESRENELSPKSKIDYTEIFNSMYRKDQVPALQPEVLEGSLADYKKSLYDSIQNIDLLSLPKRKLRGGPEEVNSTQNIMAIGHYYKGQAYIETHDDDKAKLNLKWVTDSAFDQALIGKAQWYLALIYVKEKNKPQAIVLLKAVKRNSDATTYNKKAEELLRVLR